MERNNDSVTDLTLDIRAFAQERDWEQYHDPKSLVLALVGEVGELAELFQWIPAEAAVAEFSDATKKQRAAEEISDVMIYLMRLADVLGIDVGPAVSAKIADARARFRVDEVRGEAPEKY